MLKKQEGFTLIELLVVIAIIGLLSSVVLVSMGGSRNSAKDANIKSDIAQIRTLSEVSYAEDNDYDGLCDRTDEGQLATDITSNGGTAYVCADSASAWCVMATLNDGTTKWCVDSATAAPSGSATYDCEAGVDYTCAP